VHAAVDSALPLLLSQAAQRDQSCPDLSQQPAADVHEQQQLTLQPLQT
jgi:hypothetical protein